MDQRLLHSYDEFEGFVKGYNQVFLICGDRSFKNCDKLVNALDNGGVSYSRFSSFTPNPTTESVDAGIQAFRDSDFDAIIAVGGGSAIDIAKCIKLYGGGGQKTWDERLSNQSHPVDVPLIVMPTTAGSGSEVTIFAVIYHKGVKQSITADAILPNAVIYDSSALHVLPDYQKKATVFDALCHCIESFWSINSTDESKEYAKEGIELILKNVDEYWGGVSDDHVYSSVQKAAYLAGRAINITQTTAGHAMSYKLTSMYGCSHGHAVALCVKELWPWMLENINLCRDERGQKYLENTFEELSAVIGGSGSGDGVEWFKKLFRDSRLDVPMIKDGEIDVLVESVNPTRLKNNPVELSNTDIRMLYQRILKN